MVARTRFAVLVAIASFALPGLTSAAAAADRPPIINVISPLNDTVARPFVHVVAQCEDDDVRGCAQIAARAINPVCGYVPISATVASSSIDVYLGVCGDIEISGTDRAGQVTTVRRRLVIESTPTLREVQSVAGRILDVTADRILFMADVPGGSVLKVHDRTTGADTTVPLPAAAAALSPLSFGYLTPRGVIYQYLNPALGIDAMINGSRAYEWRDGVLIPFSFSQWGSMSVNGDVAAWLGEHGNSWTGSEYVIFRRDLAAGTMTEVTFSGGLGGWPSVGANGDVVFQARRGTTVQGDVIRLRAGVTTALTSDPLSSHSRPVTDGINVAAWRRSIGGSSDIVLITAGGAEETLASGFSLPPFPEYAINGGWTAFSKSSGGVDQGWARAADGTLTQLTTLAANARPVALAATGEVALTSGTRLFLASPGAAAQDVASSVVKPWFINGQWYFSAGRTLFTRTTAPCTYSVTPRTLRFGRYGGDGIIHVSASGSACGWGTSFVPPYVVVTSGHFGFGDGRVTIRTLDQQTTGGLTNTWTIYVADLPITVIQDAAFLGTAAGDYNGDRQGDLALFRPYGGQWLVRGAGSADALQSGDPTSIPVTWPFLGAMDRGFFTPANGAWNFRRTSYPAGSYGRPGDIPAACLGGVFRPAEGRWYWRPAPSFSFTTTVDWGLPGDIPVAADYDGDGSCDIAVFRPSTGTWYVRGITTALWGAPGDIPVPADYDGDGRTDIAVYRPSIGRWYVKDLFTLDYGLPGDLPAPVDVDGDGRANIVVFRRATGLWYVQGGGAPIAFGARGDIPVGLATVLPRSGGDIDGDRRPDAVVYEPAAGIWRVRRSVLGFTVDAAYSFGLVGDIRRVADFDGDGRGDLVLFRPETGSWYVATSVSGYTSYTESEPWGVSGDVPVPSDYDGDGVADRAVYRPGEGRWFIRQSSNGIAQTIDWGLPGDVAVPGDYDGDGRTDPAVFRPSTGRWYARRSVDGSMLAIDWGLSTDTPAPADFDADGKLDLAVFRPSTGTWWIRYSAGNFATYSSIAYGTAIDIPAPGDYDGDGLAEPAYFRPGTGWFALGSGLIGMSASTQDQAITRR